LLSSCSKPKIIPDEIVEGIRTEIAEENGLPPDAVFIIEIKNCRSDNALFYIVEVLLQEAEYLKATYAVQIDKDKNSLHIMEWQIKEKI
jgi:hypothetical protein